MMSKIEAGEKIPETVDELPETTDEMFGSAEERPPETVDELSETIDGLPEMGKGSSSLGGVARAREKKAPLRAFAGKRTYYKEVLQEILPYLLAVLILLGVTQATVGVLWYGQMNRRDELNQIYGEEYERE